MSERFRNHPWIWAIGLVVTLLLIVGPILFFIPGEAEATDNPLAHLPGQRPHTDHSSLLTGPFTTGEEVTAACLECHEDSAQQVMSTVHWTWESKPYDLEGRDEPVTVGKKNSINNFCLGIQGNWASCTTCHAGYGWSDASFDFQAEEKVDCLVCHDQSGGYVKGKAGVPVEGVDLLAAAQSVGSPTRENCGTCHFNGGGGNAVKHGDMDEHLYYPDEALDVHMGKLEFECITCHQTEDHNIQGRSISVSLDLENQITCTNCHSEDLHEDERLNAHVQSVACETCHIPASGRGDPSKVQWDWSTAGLDIPDDPHTYLKIKGSFVYEENFIPEYYWYSGIKERYILGDEIDPEQPVLINTLAGDIQDPQAKIYPFKVHIAQQPYDIVNNILIQPRTSGEGGLWTTFDWPSALALGAEDTGVDYSGEFGFTETWMFWTQNHTVAPAVEALECVACHSENGRLDWSALGYPGDPVEWGGRFRNQP